MRKHCLLATLFVLSLVGWSPTGALAQGAVAGGTPVPTTTGGGGATSASDLAKQLANPIARLVSVPFQLNYDTGLGSTDANRWTLNLQPVVPFDLGANYNLISRTILPIIDAEATTPGGDSASGLGDAVQSFFFSPKKPVGGWIVMFRSRFPCQTGTFVPLERS